MAEFENLIFDILYIFRLIIGMVVLAFNFIIFSIFAMKKKRSPSDCLVLPNLMIEGLHGLGLCVPLYFLDPDWVMKGQFCLQILVFFSLVVLILMAFNRYVAAVRPLKYKLWFKKRFIFLGFSGITLVTVALFIATCYVLFIAKVVEKSVEHFCETYYTERSYYVYETEYNHWHYRSRVYGRSVNVCTKYMDFPYYPQPKRVPKLKTAIESHERCDENITFHDKALVTVDYFVLYLWPQFQLVLVIINTVFIYFFYKKLYNKFHAGRNFGLCASLYKTVRDLFREEVSLESKTLENKLSVEAVQETNFLQTCLPSGK